MAVYIELFHGRHTPHEDLGDDWGFQGPILGPFPYFHMTYGCHVKMGDIGNNNQGHLITEFTVYQDGLLGFAGALYGDVSIFDRSLLNKNPKLKEQWQESMRIIKTPRDKLPLLLGHEWEWVKIFAEKGLKNDTSYS